MAGILLAACAGTEPRPARATEALDRELVVEIAEIREADQRYRSGIFADQDLYVHSEKWELQRELDRKNLEKVTRILETRGYPGRTLVGPKLETTASLVIQHADTPTQERFLPTLEAAVAAGELPAASVALLVDRIAVSKGLPQRYGTQVHRPDASAPWQPYPIEDPDEVDARRLAVGLGPLADYLARFSGTP